MGLIIPPLDRIGNSPQLDHRNHKGQGGETGRRARFRIWCPSDVQVRFLSLVLISLCCGDSLPERGDTRNNSWVPMVAMLSARSILLTVNPRCEVLIGNGVVCLLLAGAWPSKADLHRFESADGSKSFYAELLRCYDKKKTGDGSQGKRKGNAFSGLSSQ